MPSVYSTQVLFDQLFHIFDRLEDTRIVSILEVFAHILQSLADLLPEPSCRVRKELDSVPRES